MLELDNAMTIDSLNGSAEREASRLADSVGDLVAKGKKQAKARVGDALGVTEDVYGRADKAARGALRRAGHQAIGLRRELKGVMGDRPLLAVGIALGLGIALGALLLTGSQAAYDRG